MITFRDTLTGKMIGTSFKVLFTFFKDNPRFREANRDPADYFLCRNPYQRTLSLFLDKCRRNALTLKPENSQIVLAKALALKSTRELADLTFCDFCRALPKVLILDQHFMRQVHGFKLTDRGVIVKIESGLEWLGKESGVDFSVKVNARQPVRDGDFLNSETMPLIYHLYLRDFLDFQYPP